MLIGIDSHNLEGKRTGVGRYLFNLLKEWSTELKGRHSEQNERSLANAGPAFLGDSSAFGLRMTDKSVKFVLYFKDEIPDDIPKSDLFESKLLEVSSTAKFIHWDLPRAAKKDKVDILFCPGYVAPIFYGGKFALALHDIIYETHPEWFSWPSPADRILLKWVSKKAVRKATVIFVPSEFTRQEVIKYYKVASEKVILARLGVETAPFVFSETEVQMIKEKYRIKNKFAFYVGSIFSRRHLTEIIIAFGKLARQMPDFQLFLAGKDYTQEKNIADLIVCLNDELSREVVVRVDFVSENDLKLLYSACAFFIWLSDYEGFGLPPLEAMSFGVPVLTSDVTSLKEVVGQAALIIKNNSDTEEIYQAMKNIVDNDSLRNELIKKGREQAAKFSWQECADKTQGKLLE